MKWRLGHNQVPLAVCFILMIAASAVSCASRDTDRAVLQNAPRILLAQCPVCVLHHLGLYKREKLHHKYLWRVELKALNC